MPNFLDEPLIDIKVKPLKLTKYKSRFKSVERVRNATQKTAKLIRENNYKIADWILNTKLPNNVSKSLTVDVQAFIKLVKNSKYNSSIDIKPEPDKTDELSRESESAFKKNVVIYEMKILDEMDCLNQMQLLDSR